MKERTSIISVVVAFLLLLVSTGAAQEVEVDNFMPAGTAYCYNAQVLAGNPGNPTATYRLDILAQTFSANGRTSGLEAGFRSRGVTCSGMTFVNNKPDWRPDR
jgi:hypothetical protein